MLVKSIIIVKFALAFLVLAFVLKLLNDLESGGVAGQQIPVRISLPKEMRTSSPENNQIKVLSHNDDFFSKTLNVNGLTAVEGKATVHSTSWKQNLVLSLNAYLEAFTKIIILFFLLRILHSIKRKEAFAISTVRNVRWMGITLILVPILGFIITKTQSFIMPEMRFISDTVNFSNINMYVVTSYNLTTVFVGILLIVLAQVFGMGYNLQKEQELTI